VRRAKLEGGVARQQANPTGFWCSVVLEHRYYGQSWPVPNLTTDNFRYLTTKQSLDDATHFARNIKFPGLEHVNLTAPHTAWISYGGSYAGGQSAFLRKLYPDVWWGSIASSAVTKVSSSWSPAPLTTSSADRPRRPTLTGDRRLLGLFRANSGQWTGRLHVTLDQTHYRDR